MVKILYVITKSNWGGAQRHVFDLATGMKEKGHDVWVALGGEGILKQKLEAAGIYTFSISEMGRDISVGKDAGSFKQIYTVIKNKKPDIVHLHSPKAAGLGAMAGRLLGVKSIVYTVHGWAFNEDRPIWQKASIAFFSWLTMLFSHKVILISQREYDQTKRFPGVEEKIKLIPLGMRAPIFISVEGAKRELSKIVGTDISKKTVFGTIAELHPNKGLKFLIDAMATVAEQYPQAICIVIGDGQDRAMLEARIHELKLENNVYLVGFIDHASEYLKAFNMFVLPSLKEGLPYTILEAGYASLPVVGTTVGGIPELVDDMKSGILVQPKHTSELAHALSFMIEHPDERRKYGASLREKIVTQFSLEKMLSSIDDLYAGK